MFLATFVGLFFDHQAFDCCVTGLTFKRELQVISNQRYMLAETPSATSDQNLHYLLQKVSHELHQPPDMVCAVLPPWETATIRILLPQAARSYLERTVGYEIEKHIPWPRDGVFFAIDSVREFPDERLSVLCTALPKSRHLFYHEMLTDVGLAPSFFLSTPYVLARSMASAIPPASAGFFVCIKALNRGIELICVEEGMPSHAYYLESGDGHDGGRGSVHEELSLYLDKTGIETSPRIVLPVGLEEWAKENALATFGEVTAYSDSAFDLALGGVQAAVLGTPPDGPNLLPRELRCSRGKKRTWLAATLGITAAVLFFVYLYAGVYGKTRQLEQLELLISEKKRQTQEVTRLKEQNRKVSEQIRDLRALVQPVSFVDTLRALTESIAPPGWLNELSWTDQDVTLSGFSPSAADLLLALEKGSLLKEVNFVSPTQKVGDLEQFRIKGKLIEIRPQTFEK